MVHVGIMMTGQQTEMHTNSEQLRGSGNRWDRQLLWSFKKNDRTSSTLKLLSRRMTFDHFFRLRISDFEAFLRKSCATSFRPKGLHEHYGAFTFIWLSHNGEGKAGSKTTETKLKYNTVDANVNERTTTR